MVASYALIVPLAQGEAARRIVASLGIGRSDLKLGRRDGKLLIPIAAPADVGIPGALVEMHDFEPYTATRTYKDVVRVPEPLRANLPSAFDVVGDLVVIKVPDPLRPHGAEIGRAILQAHANIKGVFHDDGVFGATRLRRLVHLAGEERTRTIHAEYGARFYVDLATAYFSPRLANEHERVASSVRQGEHFVDATAGVGPFTILAARRKKAERITAMDLNPSAVALLRQNLELNKVEQDVEVHEADATRMLAELAPFQRVAINLPHGGQKILESAWRHATAPATLHYTCAVASEDLEATGRRVVDDMTRMTSRAGRLLLARIVHPYSPSEVIAAFDMEVTGRSSH